MNSHDDYGELTEQVERIFLVQPLHEISKLGKILSCMAEYKHAEIKIIEKQITIHNNDNN